MSKELFLCNKCGKYTPLIRKFDSLPDNVEHHYAECQSCGYRSTIMYLNPEIKALMYQQKITKFGTRKKEKLTIKIKEMIDALQYKVESVG